MDGAAVSVPGNRQDGRGGKVTVKAMCTKVEKSERGKKKKMVVTIEGWWKKSL